MQNRKRNIQIKFWVTEEERELIKLRMAQLPTQNIGAYMRKMAINGLIIYTDMTDIKETNRELSAIGRNINQIARRVNETNSIYKEDIVELKNYMDEIWKLQRKILLSLPEVPKVVHI